MIYRGTDRNLVEKPGGESVSSAGSVHHRHLMRRVGERAVAAVNDDPIRTTGHDHGTHSPLPTSPQGSWRPYWASDPIT